jgi:hypothetical protein
MNEPSPSTELHASTLAVRRAAAVVLARPRTEPQTFWRQMFERPAERHYLDEVRAFVRALGEILDVPTRELSALDLRALEAHVDEVVEHIEGHVTGASAAGHVTAAQAMVAAVYAVRARLEEIVVRGAGR